MRRTGARAALLVVAGLLAAGCGSRTATDPSASGAASASAGSGPVLSEVVGATSGAGTARVLVRTETSAGSVGSDASLRSTGTAEGLVDFASGDRQLVSALPTGGRTESRLVGGKLYTRLPSAPTGAGAGKPWLELPVPKGAGQGLLGLTDPTGGLALLREAAGPLTEIGREQVRDADTTHYRTELDVGKIPVPSATADRPVGAGDSATLLRRLLGDAPLPLEVWIDDQQRLRRFTLVVPLPDVSRLAPGGAEPTGPASAGARPAPATSEPATPGPATPGPGGGSSTSTTEYYDFGVAVDVQAPPADQVRSVPVPATRRPSASPSPSPS